MDITTLKLKIDASGRKVTALGQEYVRAKDETAAKKVLVKMFAEISQQILMLGVSSPLNSPIDFWFL
jgi:hypothetical protein